MKKQLKHLLKRFNLYYNLQGSYRATLKFFNKLYYRLSYLSHKGKGFTCNACGEKYDRFVQRIAKGNIAKPLEKHHVIAGYGENIFCPNCMSTTRDRLVLAVLAEHFNVDGKKVLHMSPEEAVSDFLRARAIVTSTDVEPGFYKRIDPRTQFADITRLPFADASFDIIVANHILEHIPDDDIAMLELKRVLKPDGLALLQVPFSKNIETTIEEPAINDPLLQEKLFGQKDHVRIYAGADYAGRLQAAGFRVKILKENETAHYRQFAIQENEWVFIASH